MRLKTVTITEFKAIRDSGTFDTGDVTCLVGKNEAGKTALLQALYRLNPVVPEHTKFDVNDDYPRSDVEDYRQDIENGNREPATVVTADFELGDEEVAAVEREVGRGVLQSRLVQLKRGYYDTLHFTLHLNEGVAVKHLIATAELPPEARKLAEGQPSLRELEVHLGTMAQEQERAHREASAAAEAIVDPQEQAKAKDDADRLRESAAAKQLRVSLAAYTKEGLPRHIWEKHLRAHLPKFLYFDEFYQMEGQLNVQKLKERQRSGSLLDSDRPMLGLIDLARLDLDQLLAASNTQELLNKLEGASVHLSKQILKYWSQNKHIRVTFDLRQALKDDPEGMRDGMNLWGLVHDTAHLATTRLGTRSRGFIWFFSFLAWFSQQRKLGQPLILLLDEPGLFLHASAQADLLNYIEAELKPHHQVIYTTHSPFMVAPAKFDRVRIVRDRSMESDDALPGDQQGTKVSVDVLEADAGSLFPLQGALGYDIAQSLFVGPNSLVIEGVSDLLYIQSMNEVLRSRGRVALDSSWTLTPVGGADKVPTFVALLGAQKKLRIATLIDLQKKDEQQIENLFKKKLLLRSSVRTFAEFAGKPEADIEDMFDPGFYLELVNAEYSKDLPSPLSLADLTSQHPRILVRLEELFRARPLRGGALSHYRPARHLSERIAALSERIDDATIERFERAFKALNELL